MTKKLGYRSDPPHGGRAIRRLDTVVVEITALTRSQARALILAGKVRVDGEPSTKRGAPVPESGRVAGEEPPRYVSRGGDKLAAALSDFAVDVSGLDVLDVG